MKKIFTDIFNIFTKLKYRYIYNYQYFHYWPNLTSKVRGKIKCFINLFPCNTSWVVKSSGCWALWHISWLRVHFARWVWAVNVEPGEDIGHFAQKKVDKQCWAVREWTKVAHFFQIKVGGVEPFGSPKTT